MLPLQPSDVRAATPPGTPPLSISLQGKGLPPPLPSAVSADAPLLSALLPQQVEPPLQPSAINPPPIPQISALNLQLYAPPLHTSVECAPPPPQISVLLQGKGKPPILSSTVHTYVPLISAFILRKCVHISKPSADPAPIPKISA